MRKQNSSNSVDVIYGSFSLLGSYDNQNHVQSVDLI